MLSLYLSVAFVDLTRASRLWACAKAKFDNAVSVAFELRRKPAEDFDLMPATRAG